ncbi:hypothetical protein SLS64_002349 [Diaporthe eres]
MGAEKSIKSVAIIGAGASGTITAAALKAENYFDQIRIFERRETAGGTWIFDASPGPELPINPGKLPPQIDPPVQIPDQLPRVTAPVEQERYSKTPVYNSLTTTVEDVSRIPPPSSELDLDRWRLTLRKHDALRQVDVWWTEEFDALVIANGHYSVPFIPHVDGLEEYIKKYPDRVVHSKYYRSPTVYSGQKVLTIGNSASGSDIFNELTKTAQLPVYSSRRHKSPFEGDKPQPGVEWKPIITRYHADGTIEFEDGTTLGADDVDKIIYATGYRPSFPFWNERANGRPIYDYEVGKLVNTYWHTFFHDLPTLAVVGIEKGLTFRSFEYQAVALARLFSGRNAVPLPPAREQRRWEEERTEWVKATGKKFHDIESEPGRLGEDSFKWLGYLYRLAGLGTLTGDGRVPPVLSKELLHAVRTIHKYPRYDEDVADAEVYDYHGVSSSGGKQAAKEWVTAVLDGKKSKDRRANKRSAERVEAAAEEEEDEDTAAAPSRGRAKDKAAQQAQSDFDREAAFDLGDVDAEYARVDERFEKRLQEFKVGGRFNPEMLGQLRVRPDRESAQSWPLRELAQVVHRGGRSVSILVSDAEYVKPIMSAVQNSDDFNQQPQRDPDNELELLLRIEPEDPEEQLRRLRAEITAWRDAVRGVMAARKHRHAAWLKEKHVTKDDVKALEKKVKSMQDKKIEQVDRSEKQIVQQMAKRQTRL